MNKSQQRLRVLSGMRPTGALHIGHYHGALKNWVQLQERYNCFYFVADWHALTTHYQSPEVIENNTIEMVIDWLAAGLDADKVTIFQQSRIPQHAELFVLLSMSTPLAWLERVPTYKDQIQKLADRDLNTLGFLSYPLLQASDIIAYGASFVPVGEDQVPHIELTREIARRFNHLYGSIDEAIFLQVIAKLNPDIKKLILTAQKQFLQEGKRELLTRALAELSNFVDLLTAEELTLIEGALQGNVKQILVEAQALLTPTPKLPGMDGQKMSKSYDNTITLREAPESIQSKLKKMPTDPKRIRRNDKGNPEQCPVFDLHRVYSTETMQSEIYAGCTQAQIGCTDCKNQLTQVIAGTHQPMRERAQVLMQKPDQVKQILQAGNKKARQEAEKTLNKVREAVGLKGVADDF